MLQSVRPYIGYSQPALKNVPSKSLTVFVASTSCSRPRSTPISTAATKSASSTTSLSNSTITRNPTSPASALTRIPLSHPRIHRSSAIGRAAYATAAYATAAATMENPSIHEMLEAVTGTWQYVVADPATSTAVIIDPVWNYDPATSKLSTESADALLKFVVEKGYKIDMILETHAHADHITAASYLQKCLAKKQSHKPLIGIGSRIKQVQKMFGEKYCIPPEEYEDVFDRLWEDNEIFKIGNMTAQAIHLPGHTPDHMGYKIGNNVFVGDSVLNADIGSARADFPGGSAEAIFSSGRKLFALPDHTKIWIGHDYPPAGRAAHVPFMTVKQHKQENKHLKDGISEQEFVEMRRKRDETLAEPRLIHPALQMNIRAGRLPEPTASGHRMMHMPLKLENVDW